MINRYYNRRPYEGKLYAPPVEVIGMGLEKLQKQYDTNFAVSEELKNKYVNSLEEDRAAANALQQKYEGRIKEVVDKYKGDYSRAGKDLYKLQAEMAKDYNPGGEAAAYEANFKNWNDSMTREQARLAKGEITQDQLNSLMNWRGKNFKGTVKDPKTGTYSMLNTPSLAEYQDGLEIADKATEKVKPRVIKTNQEYKTGDGRIVSRTIETSDIDPNEMRNTIESALVGNRKYTNYIQQLAWLNGQDDQEMLKTYVQNYSDSLTPIRSGNFLYSDISKSEADPFALASLNHRYRMAEIDHKNQLQQEENAAGTGSQLALLGAANGATSAYKPVDVNGGNKMGAGWKGVINTLSPASWAVKWGAEALGLDNAGLGDAVNAMIPNAAPPVNKAIQSNNTKDYNVPLLSSIKQANPNVSDKDIWTMYNTSLGKDKYGTGIYYDKYKTSAAQKEELTRTIPLLQTGQVRVYALDSKLGKVNQLSQAEISRLSFKDPDGHIKPGVSALGKSSPQTGHNIPFGTVITGGDGTTYIVSENEERMNQLNEYVFPKAFNFINDGRTAGETFQITTPGGTVNVAGRNEYKFDPITHTSSREVRYYQIHDVDRDGNPIFDLNTKDETGLPKDLLYNKDEYGNLNIWTPSHVAEALYGKSKSNYLPKNKMSGDKEYNTNIED